MGKPPMWGITHMLIGEYQHTIDTKKRLSLPAKFRKELGRTVIVTKGLENCLVVFSEKEWQVRSEKLGKLPDSQVEVRTYVRVILGGAMEVTIDGLGRILVPDYLKKYAHLKKNVVVCGLSNRLELWDSAAWERYKKKAEKNVSNLAAKLGELGI